MGNDKKSFTEESVIDNLRRISLPASICGIYFLIHNNRVVYVGQSIDVFTRVNSHVKERKKEFDSFTYVECSLEELDELEMHYVNVIAPPLNKSVTPGFGLISVYQWATKVGVSHLTIRQFILFSGGAMKQKRWYTEDDMKAFLMYAATVLKPKIERSSQIRPYIDITEDSVVNFYLQNSL